MKETFLYLYGSSDSFPITVNCVVDVFGFGKNLDVSFSAFLCLSIPYCYTIKYEIGLCT